MARVRPLDAAALSRLKRRFDLVPQVMQDAARRTLDAAAQDMVTEMRRAIDTREGDLAASVRATDISEPHAIRVRVSAGGQKTTRKVRQGVRDGDAGQGKGVYDYARAIEYGTAIAPPEPFFRPTRDRHAKRLRFRLRNAIRKALQGMAGD